MFKNLNIKITILVALFIGLAVPMFFTTVHLQNKYEQELKNELTKTHKELLKTISSGLTRPMWEFMYDNAKDLVEPIFNNEDILEIKVVDIKYDNEVFLHFKKNILSNNPSCQESQTILLEENILLNKLKLGMVSMKFSTCKISQQIAQQRDSLWLTMGIQFMISFVVLFLLMHSKIIIPVKKLIQQSTSLANKRLNNPFIWRQNDEMGHLGQSLESTRIALLELFHKEQKSKEEIEELNKNLEYKVKDRTQKLIDVNSELKQSIDNLEMAQEQLIHSEKMASLGNMVSGISHEINTPIGVGLTGITHFQEITKEIKDAYEKNDISQSEFEEYLNMSSSLANSINKNLRRAADLIGGFKKISVDQEINEIRVINLYEYTMDFVNSMYGTLLKTNITMKVDTTHDIDINCSPGSYSQFLMILVTNSLLHAYDEGEQGLIQIDLRMNGNLVIIAFSDDGKGINKDDMKHIYEPFFTTKRGHGGSGLGLNILYNVITKSCKGKVRCKSKLGEGTKFIITLPLDLENPVP